MGCSGVLHQPEERLHTEQTHLSTTQGPLCLHLTKKRKAKSYQPSSKAAGALDYDLVPVPHLLFVSFSKPCLGPEPTTPVRILHATRAVRGMRSQ